MRFFLVRRLSRLFTHTMSSVSTTLSCPVDVRGMTSLDRDKFSRNIEVPVLKVEQAKVSKISHICKPYFLKIENFKPVQNGEHEHIKYFYLNPDKISQWSDISEMDQGKLSQNGIESSSLTKKHIQLSYSNWKSETIFKAVLPESEESFSSFSQMGHLIHINLKDHLLPYGKLIGEVLIDKIKTCRTVINKSNIIDNTYRNFKMELLAGEHNFLVTVKENRCNFQFDFSKVYWNTRLCKEHERILEFLRPGDVLFDVFCGVGPFSVPAAKLGCKVFANDLNPDSYTWLNHNAKSNKVKMEFFEAFNEDGKDFICGPLKDYLVKYCNGNEKLHKDSKICITMNLPAMAVEFLKYFKGLLKDKYAHDKFDLKIIIYVYCFAVGDDSVSIAKKMVSDNMGCDMSNYILDVFDVRNVSPKKEMMRVTINLVKDILFNIENESAVEPPSKKLCL